MNRDRQEAGYAMAALIVGMAIMAVMMTVAMPVWKQTVQREKEEELVWRGEQYCPRDWPVPAQVCQRLPADIDLLVEQKFLRKKYKDPITNEDFVPLTQARGQRQTPAECRPGARWRAAAQGRHPRRSRRQPVQSRRRRRHRRTRSAGRPGGIIGVTSKSKDFRFASTTAARITTNGPSSTPRRRRPQGVAALARRADPAAKAHQVVRTDRSGQMDQVDRMDPAVVAAREAAAGRGRRRADRAFPADVARGPAAHRHFHSQPAPGKVARPQLTSA